MNREAWLVFLGLTGVAAFGLLGVFAWQKHQQLANAQRQVAEVRTMAESQSARLAEAWQEVEVARGRVEALAQQIEVATNSQQRLETEMRGALESRDVAISELRGSLTVTILDRILFDSGDARLKPEGMQVLDKVAKVLAHYTNRPVQVFGHTDNVPIHVKYPSNWELSTARAVAAVRYLTEHAGVEPGRLSAVGCGEFQPIAPNDRAEGRSRNRRIALVVLPELFAPTDVVPSETNAPPVTQVSEPTSDREATNQAPAAEVESIAPEGDSAPVLQSVEE